MVMPSVVNIYSYQMSEPMNKCYSEELGSVVAPMFGSGHWHTPNGHEVLYEWDEAARRAGMDRALKLTERAQQGPSGRLRGVLMPSQSIPAPKSCCARPGATLIGWQTAAH
jgi:hypothetical protein